MQNPLLEQLRFPNGRQASNRIWLAPMTNQQSHEDGSLSDEELRWLSARAEGGFGVITSCATHVHLDGHAWRGQLGCFDDRLISGWQRLAKTVQGHGAILLGQLFHGGNRASLSKDPWSCQASPGGKVRQAEEADILRVIEDFANAAARLAQAGADGVELHGAHGYLLCQFLSAQNQREDIWGGSLENRSRLLRRTLQRVREKVDSSFIVGVRLSPEDFMATKGLDLDESLQTAQWLSEDGADYIHISLWDARKNSEKYPDRHPAQIFRKGLDPAVPLITAGHIWSEEDALRQLEFGADAVALGRSAIANADWPQRVLEKGLAPNMPPRTVEELRAQALSPPFIEYMKGWPGFVRD